MNQPFVQFACEFQAAGRLGCKMARLVKVLEQPCRKLQGVRGFLKSDSIAPQSLRELQKAFLEVPSWPTDLNLGAHAHARR